MCLAVLRSRALNGIDAPPVSVEIHLANGLPAFNIVGLADTEVRESRERVRAALLNSDFDFPNRRITVNLTPADMPKESGRFVMFDLAIALGILAASGQLPGDGLDAFEFAGELSLAGDLRPVRGAPAMGLARDNRARLADGHPPRAFVVAIDNGPEAALVQDLKVHAGATLHDVCHHVGLLPEQALRRALPPERGADAADGPDLRDVRGQLQARHAMEVAAAGQHSVLLVGPPGTGKSMLAQRFPGLLPPMTEAQALEAAAVLSLTPGGFQPSHWGRRPFRSPHHTASGPAMVGGGGNPRPGEISLAHHGVLFLDELEVRSCQAVCPVRPECAGRLSGPRPVRGGDEPVPVRLPGPSHAHVPLHAGPDPALPVTHLRAAARPRGTCRSKCPPKASTRCWTARPANPASPGATARWPHATATLRGRACPTATCPAAPSTSTARSTLPPRPCCVAPWKTGLVGTRVLPRAQGGSHHRRPGGRRGADRRACGRGHSVSAGVTDGVRGMRWL
ncbi:hypothetical protein CBA19C6_15705 [Cupriavidus pauculus]|nr:hypothetical protein CBA19C6_15705 [Cupriavidus pauculus]